MVIWRTSCVCKELHPNFTVLATGSPLFYLVSTAGLSETSESFFLMRRVSPLLFHQPAKVCILQSHLRNKSTLLRMCLIYHSSYCRVSPKQSASPDFDMPSDLMRWKNSSQEKENVIITAGRDLDTTISSLFCELCILFAIVEQFIKLKFCVLHKTMLHWLILKKSKNCSTHHVWNSL